MGEHQSILLTGGSACGKSSYAEALICSMSGRRIYVATMRPFGEQGAAKVKRHRAVRAGKGFDTVECYGSLLDIDQDELCGHAGTLCGDETAARPAILLECMANLTANLLFGDDGMLQDPAEVVEEICKGIEYLRTCSRLLVIVTNDVGSDGCDYGTQTNAYVRTLGAVNCKLAACCDAVAECVAGYPVAVKGRVPQVDVTEGALRW